MKTNILNIKILIVILFLLNIAACKEDTPPVVPPQPPQTKVVLTEENKSCTEIWLKLSLENFTLPVNVESEKR